MAHNSKEFQTRHDVNGVDFPTARSEHFREEVLAILRDLTNRVAPVKSTSDNFGKLRLASTDVYEAVAVLTEYLSPDQHGNIFGKVFRRYYAVPEVTDASTGATIDLGFTISGRVVKAEGMVELEAGGTFYPLPYADVAAAGDAGISLQVTLDDILLVKTTLVSDWKAGGFILVDYTK